MENVLRKCVGTQCKGSSDVFNDGANVAG